MRYSKFTPHRDLCIVESMQFAPSVYEHAARVIGESPWDVSRDVHLLAQGHIAAYRLYQHRPIVVGIDIYNLEAEAYGAVVSRASGNGIPAIHEHPFSTASQLIDLEPFDPKSAGRIPMAIAAARRCAAACPGADVRVPLSGPFSLATNLMGFEDILCEIQTAPDLVAQALLSLVKGQVAFCREIVHHGLGIAFFESAAAPPLLSPANFRDIELPALRATMTEPRPGQPSSPLHHGRRHPAHPRLPSRHGDRLRLLPRGDQSAGIHGEDEVPPRSESPDQHGPAPNHGERLRRHHKEVDRVIALAADSADICIGTGCLPFEADPQMVLKTKDYILSKNAL